MSDLFEYADLPEHQRIAFGYRPRTLKGWAFWLRHWSPPVCWARRWRVYRARE